MQVGGWAALSFSVAAAGGSQLVGGSRVLVLVVVVGLFFQCAWNMKMEIKCVYGTMECVRRVESS